MNILTTMKKLLKGAVHLFGGILYTLLHPLRLRDILWSIYRNIYTGYTKRCFRSVGNGTIFAPSFRSLLGAKYITIGSKCVFREKTKLTAWDKYNSQTFHPEIRIGNCCGIGAYSHITAINKIVIGNNVGTGDFILITDNSHGYGDTDEFNCRVGEKRLFSQGPVIIGDNVWIGEYSCILPDVTIGRGCVIGAASIIRQSVPPYSIVVGNPAKVVGFVYAPKEIYEQEAKIYPLEERIPLEKLEQNYRKYYLERRREIISFLKNKI